MKSQKPSHQLVVHDFKEIFPDLDTNFSNVALGEI